MNIEQSYCLACGATEGHKASCPTLTPAHEPAFLTPEHWPACWLAMYRSQITGLVGVDEKDTVTRLTLGSRTTVAKNGRVTYTCPCGANAWRSGFGFNNEEIQNFVKEHTEHLEPWERNAPEVI